MIALETVALNRLYDYYGVLLTERQQEVFRYYYHEDYSYQEIADLLEISRAGVYDNLKRAKSSLENYEEKLRFSQRLDLMFESLKKLENKEVEEILNTFYDGGKYD